MFKISICQLVMMWWVYTNSIYFDKLLCDWRLTALHLTTNENDERIPPELENGWWWTLKYMRRERLHWETPWQVTCRDQTQIFQFVSDENIDYICLPQDSCNCEVRGETSKWSQWDWGSHCLFWTPIKSAQQKMIVVLKLNPGPHTGANIESRWQCKYTAPVVTGRLSRSHSLTSHKGEGREGEGGESL